MPTTRRNSRWASAATRSHRTRTPEHDIHVALIEWVEWQQNRYPCLDLLYAIPNGGDRHRVVAAKLKAEGLRSAVPDLCLPVARQGYHGLYVEMKAPGGSESANQKWWRRRLSEEGYRSVVRIGHPVVKQGGGWDKLSHPLCVMPDYPS